MEFLKELDAEVLKIELLTFLDSNDVEIDNLEDFKDQFIAFIEEDFSYVDCE
jgi:hypothetical protein